MLLETKPFRYEELEIINLDEDEQVQKEGE